MRPAMLLLLTLPVAAQSIEGNPQCAAAFHEGMTLLEADKLNEAIAKFQEAHKADPKASAPYSGIAQAFNLASGRASEEHVKEYRDRAEAFARQALELQPTDPLALEVLRGLSGDLLPDRHQATPEAKKALDAAELCFQKGQYAEAEQGYEAAFKLDPALAQAKKFAGDALFQLAKYEAAEADFRKAVELDPMDAQGWRFLGDALAHQGRTSDAASATLSSVAAQPNYQPAWNQLSYLRSLTGKPLQPLLLSEAARTALKPTTVKDGHIDLTLGNSSGDGAADAIWLAYSLSKAAGALPPKKGEAIPSLFVAELKNWQAACESMLQLAKEGKPGPKDSMLTAFLGFHKDGTLEAAIFLLLYRETYRPDFEAWKKQHPTAIQAFVDRYGLQPPAR